MFLRQVRGEGVVPVLGREFGVLLPLGVPGAELGPAPITAARLGLAATVLLAEGPERGGKGGVLV